MATAAPAAPALALAPRTRRILSAPIAPTLLALAAPNVAVLVLQASVSVLEAYFVGWLGADALAGVSLVFPLVMLMQTMSAGGMGGGVASAVARALGASRRDDANRLVLHALIIAVTMGLAFTVAALTAGPVLYRIMGGQGAALDAAAQYSRAIFGGAIAFWLFNTLASVVRGTGNMFVPAATVVVVGALSMALAPTLIFGWGPFPRLGVAGAGVAAISVHALGACVLATFIILSGRSLVRPALAGFRFERRLFAEILRVGAPAALNTIQTNLTVAILTGLVGGFGTYAVAGYGLGARLEYLQIPIVFGLGAALVTMVGTNVGAGQHARARRVAWVGAGLAVLITETIGLTAAFFPHAWLGLFTSEPEVLAAGARYLRTVGPFYGFFGLGLALYFASQGAGRLLWPLLAGFMRLSLAAVGGAIVIAAGGGLSALFAVMATAMVIFGSTVAIAIGRGAWGRTKEV
ncbi:MAG: MATE family efflux transporter [Candidatus Rokubacteria bacterium]|nr:MATE family efflux transporter [Candidatus Rokubacteria bacterium]